MRETRSPGGRRLARLLRELIDDVFWKRSSNADFSLVEREEVREAVYGRTGHGSRSPAGDELPFTSTTHSPVARRGTSRSYEAAYRELWR